MDFKYTAIILSKQNIGETDRIYALYAKEAGKVKVLGKGVRKPNAKLAGSLESVTMADIFVAKNRGLGKITGAIVSDSFFGLKSNFDALSRVDYVFNIFAKIIGEQEKDEKIFNLLAGLLESLDKLRSREDNQNKMDVAVLGFLFKLLSEMGYRIEVKKCVSCGKSLKPENNYFSPARGGVLCRDCHLLENKRLKINTESIKLIRIFLKNRIENLAKLKVEPRDINNLKIILREALNWL